MKHLDIKLKCIGTPLHAISEAIIIAKAINDKIDLSFIVFSITVSKDSNINDLYEIWELKSKGFK